MKMIGKLKGIVDEILDCYVLLDVVGVGYAVNLSYPVLSRLTVGRRVVFWIDHVVSETSQKLYGYEAPEEQTLAGLLIKVKGVSHRISSNLIGFLGCDGVVEAIRLQKSESLKVPGVGAKLADRIISELADKSFGEIRLSSSSRFPVGCDEALNALEALGYHRDEARKVVFELLSDGEEGVDVPILVRKALGKLSCT